MLYGKIKLMRVAPKKEIDQNCALERARQAEERAQAGATCTRRGRGRRKRCRTSGALAADANDDGEGCGLERLHDGPDRAGIVAQCEQTCGSPGLHLVAGVEDINAPAYVQLNEILTSLYTQHEWPFLATASNPVLASRENALPSDYWRARFHDPLILLDGDSRYTLTLKDPSAWFHGGLEAATSTGRPTSFTIDKSRSSFFLDCIPDRTYNGELHYYRFVPRLTTKESVPMFPGLVAAQHFGGLVPSATTTRAGGNSKSGDGGSDCADQGVALRGLGRREHPPRSAGLSHAAFRRVVSGAAHLAFMELDLRSGITPLRRQAEIGPRPTHRAK
jgi:hypothetical protein